MKEPIPATLNHPQPAPRSPPSCGTRGGGAAGGRVAGGTTASPPGGGRFSPAPARPVVCPARPFPVPLARPLRVPAAPRAAVMVGSCAGRWGRNRCGTSVGTPRTAHYPLCRDTAAGGRAEARLSRGALWRYCPWRDGRGPGQAGGG